jgi:RNA polymerase sigma factor (sigma-70 family)
MSKPAQGHVDPAPPPEIDFETFFRDQYVRLGRALYLLTGDPSAAEDLAQEAFLRVYRRWDRIATMESPDGYLFRVALNLQSRWRRTTRQTDVRSLDSLGTREQEASTDAALDIVRALGRLPNDQRQALVLVGWLGFTSVEIGRMLGVPPASIRGRVFRARRSLRHLLKEYEKEEGIRDQEA